MPTQVEETQAREFLQRAEIRTMRKDLSRLRESDSLRERNKIATIKTLDEQLAEKQKADLAAMAALAPSKEQIRRNEVLQKNERNETVAQKDLKQYTNEEERQKIFLLESQRLDFAKQADAIIKQKDPALQLLKNELMLKERDLQNKLSKIVSQESSLDNQEKAIIAKSQSTTNAAERKSLETKRWDLDKQIQDIEKNRWEIEKQIQDLGNQKKVIDNSAQRNNLDKNNLQNKILGIDKLLREIYSSVMAREEAKIKNSPQGQQGVALSASKDYLVNPASIMPPVPRKK